MAEEFPPFDPEWLKAEEAMGGRSRLAMESPEKTRAQFTAMFAAMAASAPPPTDAVRAEDVHITPTQRIRIYTPTATQGPFPVALYIHSGGWFAGSVEAEDHLCRDIVVKSNVLLFSTDYRLAPENPYPSALDDCCVAYEFMLKSADSYGGDARRKIIMGGSAGGNLAACVGLKYASNAELNPSGLLLGAMTSFDPRTLPDEYKARYNPERYTDSPMLTAADMLIARDWYGAAPDDPLCNPLLHPDVKLLKQVYVAACTKDPTHLDSIFFYDECKKQGVKVELVEFVGWPHFFWIIPTLTKSSEFMDIWCQKLGAMLEAESQS